NGVSVQNGTSNVFVIDTLRNEDSVSVTLFSDFGCARDIDGVKISVNELIVNKNIVLPSCSNSDGSIDISVTGATGTLTYVWTAANGGILGSSANAQDQTNLPTGRYIVEIND